MTAKAPITTKITARSVKDLGHRDTARLILDYLQRLMIHHGLWFAEVKHQLGQRIALELLSEVGEKILQVQLKHLGKVLGFHLEAGFSDPLLAMEPDDLYTLSQNLAKCWLANDSIWFQAVEYRFSITDAKRCSDNCKAEFSPVEASLIKTFLGLDKRPGLAGLQQALGFRLDGGLNQQSVQRESDNALVFRMTDCRVQSACKRKNILYYHCKTSGLAEYSRFAATIDDRIFAECIGFPADLHPTECYSTWRFILPDNG